MRSPPCSTRALAEGDACFYPDSRKLLVEATVTIVRSAPQLDDFDGELPA